MYAATDGFEYNCVRRNIFTWKIKEDTIGSSGIWEFIPTDQDSVFAIRNVYYNEYLYASKLYYNKFLKIAPFTSIPSKRRYSFTWKRAVNSEKDYGNEFLWRVQHDTGNKFSLKNKRTDDYLYASKKEYDHDRRRVFNYAPGSLEPQASWEIICLT